MQALQVTFRNLNPREEVRQRAEVLYQKLHRFLDPAAEAQMLVGVEHGSAVVEMTVTSRGHVHKVVEENEQLRAALDGAMHRMEEALRRGKEKKGSSRRLQRQARDAEPPEPPSESA